MKAIFPGPLRFYALISCAVIMVFFNACARKLHFERSTVVPAAEGKVKIKKDKNKNYAVSVDVSNLAEAERLQPPKRTYVVWIETNHDRNKNVGRLNSSTGLFSKKLKASLSTITPYEPNRVFITAEDDAEISYPSGQTVLTTN